MTIFLRTKWFPIIVSIAFIFSLTGCFNRSADRYVKREIGLDVSDCTLVSDIDSHGGCHGDGERTIIFNCSNTSILDKFDKWNTFPLPQNLDLIMYGGEKNGEQYEYELAIKNNIPKIDNGYYYFIDRYTKYYKDYPDIHSADKIFDRGSYNFTLVVYDPKDNNLYYFEFDT